MEVSIYPDLGSGLSTVEIRISIVRKGRNMLFKVGKKEVWKLADPVRSLFFSVLNVSTPYKILKVYFFKGKMVLTKIFLMRSEISIFFIFYFVSLPD